ncbi:hypothetical protein ABHF91_10790 [Pseudaeromonas sp. ZJS20]|uniref:hypothetical protein n=1 Tax=Pseudaeromonas aegiceratis TaxID=3153928 RepID=UPI00390C4798
MQTVRLLYLTLYEKYLRLLLAPLTPLSTLLAARLSAAFDAHFIIPVPVGWLPPSLHVQGPINRRG